MALICPMMVATAAPSTPMAGKPNSPKMRIGSRRMLMTAPAACSSMGNTIRPTD